MPKRKTKTSCGSIIWLILLLFILSGISSVAGGVVDGAKETPTPTATAYQTKITPTPTRTPTATFSLLYIQTKAKFTRTPIHSYATQAKPKKATKTPRGSSGNIPQGITAICKDGTYSYSQHANGTCSWHGGVKKWINKP